MKKILLTVAITVFSVSLAIAQQGNTAKDAGRVESQEKSLYERLGGYEALSAVADDFITRLATDKLLGRFVIGLSDDSKGKLRQHFVEFLCKATGGSCVYLGRDMKTSHKGLAITKKDWDQSVKLLIETLDKFKVPAKEKDEVLAAIGTLEKDIVEKK
jgi:hemoglobin